MKQGLAGSMRKEALLLPSPGRVVVYFPLSASEGASLASLECMPLAQALGRRFLLSHPKFSREVEQILADVRFHEAPEYSEAGVRIRFAPSAFSGASYGLALALADKLARRTLNRSAARRPLYASGHIPADGQGAVAEVSDFAAKVTLIGTVAEKGSVFVYPQANYSRADRILRERLARLDSEHGIDCYGIEHVDELDAIFADLYEQNPDTAVSSFERKLAAILAMDVAGYSRLMGENEETTLATLSTYRALIDARVSGHGGRVFASAGDSILAEFPSPVEAVRAAVEIQAQLDECNAELAQAQRMRFRSGVNLGDVIVEGANLMGDGVNVAARLENLARPGGLCLSASVYEQVRDRLELDFDDLGEHKVKNIARPVRVYRALLPSEYHPISPFRGLSVFEYEHAEFFHGRTRAIAATKARLEQQAAAGQAFLLIYGMSGAGKSSLARAGLLPMLTRSDAVAGIDSWRYAIMRPSEGASALAALAGAILTETGLPELADADVTDSELERWFGETPDTALAAISGVLSGQANAMGAPGAKACLALLVDQLEELFTAEQMTAEKREKFVQALTLLAKSGVVWVIATLRSDFFHRCAEISGLSALKDGLGSYELLPPVAAEIGEMIRQPARAAGLHFDEDPQQGRLDDVLQRTAASQPASLPLLEFTLDALYESGQSQHQLRFADYRALGGLEGAVAQRADEIVAALPAAMQAALPATLRALVSLRPGERAATVRAAPLNESVETPERKGLVDALLDARLLAISAGHDGPVLRLAHEALLTHWPQAREIISADRRFLETRARIQLDLQRWLDEKRNTELLLPPGRRLAEAEELLGGRRNELDHDLVDYVEASLQASQRAARRTLRRTQGFAVAMALLALLAAVGGYLGLAGQQEAERRTKQARAAQAEAQHQAEQTRLMLSRQLAALALTHLDDQLDLALLLSVEASKIADTMQARHALLAALTANPRLMIYLQAHSGRVNSVAFSPDGRNLASGGSDNFLILWDINSDKMAAGKRINRHSLPGHDDAVLSVAYSPDGKILASTSEDNRILLWDVSKATAVKPGRLLGVLTSGVDTADLNQQSIASDKTRTDNPMKLWSLAAAPIRNESSVTFSPDGKTLASGSGEGVILLWDISGIAKGHRATLLAPPLNAHANAIKSIAFSPDGGVLASGSEDSTIRLWDVRRVRVSENVQPIAPPLSGHTDWVRSVAFSPDGKILASASEDGTVLLWDITHMQASGDGRIRGVPLRGYIGSVRSIAFSPDGGILASGGTDGLIQLWDMSNNDLSGMDPSLATALLGHTDRVGSMAFSADGRTLASASADGAIILWDISNRNSSALALGPPLSGHRSSVFGVAFSPDGASMASASEDNTIRFSNIEQINDSGSDRAITPGVSLGSYKLSAGAIAFSPDAKMLIASGDKGILLWDVADAGKSAGEQLEPASIINHKERVRSLAFNPNSRILASAGDARTVDLWDIDQARTAKNSPLLASLSGHRDWIWSVASSPDGRMLASGGDDNTIILWDTSQLESTGGVPAIGSPLAGHRSTVYSLAFSPDSRMLASGSDDNAIILWDVSQVNISGESQPLGAPLRAHEHGIRSMAFSPDGLMLASGGWDNTIILWDISNSRSLGIAELLAAPLRGHKASITSVAFSPDGHILASASEDRTVRLWDMNPKSWQLKACARANRNLTEAEWRKFFGARSYHKTCPDLPVLPD